MSGRGAVVVGSCLVAGVLGWGCAEPQDGPEQPGVPGSPEVVPQIWINEVMPQNRSTWQDELGAFPDWIELWNPDDVEVDLSGWWMSDDADEPFDWQIPDGVRIGPGEHLVVFCDGDEEQGELHASFKLSSLGGEDVALFGPNLMDNALVDTLEDMQILAPDQSLARLPDGGPTWGIADAATPAAPNDP